MGPDASDHGGMRSAFQGLLTVAHWIGVVAVIGVLLILGTLVIARLLESRILSSRRLASITIAALAFGFEVDQVTMRKIEWGKRAHHNRLEMPRATWTAAELRAAIIVQMTGHSLAEVAYSSLIRHPQQAQLVGQAQLMLARDGQPLPSASDAAHATLALEPQARAIVKRYEFEIEQLAKYLRRRLRLNPEKCRVLRLLINSIEYERARAQRDRLLFNSIEYEQARAGQDQRKWTPSPFGHLGSLLRTRLQPFRIPLLGTGLIYRTLVSAVVSIVVVVFTVVGAAEVLTIPAWKNLGQPPVLTQREITRFFSSFASFASIFVARFVSNLRAGYVALLHRKGVGVSETTALLAVIVGIASACVVVADYVWYKARVLNTTTWELVVRAFAVLGALSALSAIMQTLLNK
jgi:hypothetical protein